MLLVLTSHRSRKSFAKQHQKRFPDGTSFAETEPIETSTNTKDVKGIVKQRSSFLATLFSLFEGLSGGNVLVSIDWLSNTLSCDPQEAHTASNCFNVIHPLFLSASLLIC